MKRKNRGHCFNFQAGTVAGTVRALRGHCAGTVYFLSAVSPADFPLRVGSVAAAWQLRASEFASSIVLVARQLQSCHSRGQRLQGCGFAGAQPRCCPFDGRQQIESHRGENLKSKCRDIDQPINRLGGKPSISLMLPLELPLMLP